MKLGVWMMMLVGMMVFLTILGIPTGISGILEKVGFELNIDNETINGDVENSMFWTTFMMALALVSAGGAIIVGLFAKTFDVSLIIVGPVIWIAGTFIGTFWHAMLYTQNNSGGQFWRTSIVFLVFSTLAIGFTMACLDYFAGR